MKYLLALFALSLPAVACEKSTQGDVTLEICQADDATHFFVSSQNTQTLAFLVFIRTEDNTSIRLDLPVKDWPAASHGKAHLKTKILHVEVHELGDSSGVGFPLPPGGPR